MSRFLQIILAALLFASGAIVSAATQTKPLVTEWVAKDIEGVLAIVELLPFENQNIARVTARLRKNWHVEETNLGFGAKYLELEKGQGYSKGYVHAVIFNGRVAQYEAGIESYSEEWSRIRQLICDKWKMSRGPEPLEEEHRIVFRQKLPTVLKEYQVDVAAALGPMMEKSVPLELKKSYATLTDPMENSALSGTHPNDDMSDLLNSNRIDLLENVLRAYNPGARVLAAIAFLQLSKSGTKLSSKVRRSINQVLNLSIELHACVFDMCSNPTAREALRWFDSGLAFPASKTGSTRRKP